MQERETATVTGTERPPTDWQRVDWRQGQQGGSQSEATHLSGNPTRRLEHSPVAAEAHAAELQQHTRECARVTQENTGKRTPGVDNVMVKTPAARGRWSTF